MAFRDPPSGQIRGGDCRHEESIPTALRCAPKQEIAFQAQYRERDLTGR